ncbi:MAG: hypothetical protein IJB52_03730 [Clostridia bacterium]|nr:hypothetical protein [Clostridia bacterium]
MKKPWILEDAPCRKVVPQIYEKIGLNEAFLLQQVHYWLTEHEKQGKNFHDGRFWVFNTYEEWHKQLSFIQERTIRDAFKHLKELGLVVTGNFNKKGFDKTIWYSIDYDVVEKMFPQDVSNDASPDEIPVTLHDRQNLPDGSGENCRMERQKMPDGNGKNCHTNTKEYTENTPKITHQSTVAGLYGAVASTAHPEDSFSEVRRTDATYNPDLLREGIRSICQQQDILQDAVLCETVILYFVSEYWRTFRREHPRMTKATLEKVVCRIASGQIDDHDCTIAEIRTFDEWKTMIDKYLTTDGLNCDYSIVHFLSDGILLKRFYETLY